MIPRVPADIRAEIVRLRGEERLTFREIAAVVRVSPTTVKHVCQNHFFDQVKVAARALAREIAAAREEAPTAPPFHPPEWR